MFLAVLAVKQFAHRFSEIPSAAREPYRNDEAEVHIMILKASRISIESRRMSVPALIVLTIKQFAHRFF
jgi:hypothetical protein